MQIWEIFIISVALAMDAFAISICKGLTSKKPLWQTGLVCGAWFGIFQGLMPLLGWLLGSAVADYVERYKAYVAFALLAVLGVKMIIEAIKEAKEGSPCECCACENEKDNSLAPLTMLSMAIATSIDALATGVTFAAMSVNIVLAVALIALTTFVFCFFGSIVGVKLGEKFKTTAEIAGGIVLIGIGVKFLVEHLITLF
jgi:putative Mn2+ efflux pump MntP